MKRSLTFLTSWLQKTGNKSFLVASVFVLVGSFMLLHITQNKWLVYGYATSVSVITYFFADIQNIYNSAYKKMRLRKKNSAEALSGIETIAGLIALLTLCLFIGGSFYMLLELLGNIVLILTVFLAMVFVFTSAELLVKINTENYKSSLLSWTTNLPYLSLRRDDYDQIDQIVSEMDLMAIDSQKIFTGSDHREQIKKSLIIDREDQLLAIIKEHGITKYYIQSFLYGIAKYISCLIAVVAALYALRFIPKFLLLLLAESVKSLFCKEFAVGLMTGCMTMTSLFRLLAGIQNQDITYLVVTVLILLAGFVARELSIYLQTKLSLKVSFDKTKEYQVYANNWMKENYWSKLVNLE